MVVAPGESVKTLILASSSVWRQGLLLDAGLPCEVLPPDVDESSVVAADPVALALARARAKAHDVAARRPDALVLGADQVAHLEGELFGKPTDAASWLARLQALRGRTHLLTTGVALVEQGGEECFSVTTAVRFRSELTDDELRAYIATGEAAGCAGGYMMEKRGAWLIEAVEGDWWNVVGLPVPAVIGALRARGWRLDEVLRAAQARGQG